MLKRKVSCTFKRKNTLDNQEGIYPLLPPAFFPIHNSAFLLYAVFNVQRSGLTAPPKDRGWDNSRDNLFWR
jgi:hypothetical protein